MDGAKGGHAPDHPATADEFVAQMRQLKERSGLTFRQLEERAASHGDLLPRSTLADTLRRPKLPRASVVAAFVRACGGTPSDVTAWLAERDRLANQLAQAPTPSANSQAGVAPPIRPWFRSARPMVAAVVCVAVVAASVIWLGVRDEETRPAALPDPSAPSTPVVTTPMRAGPVRIQPAQAPDLCLTEGVDRSGRHTGSIATLRPCVTAEPPVTSIEPVWAGLFYIKWHHPQKGVGCLTMLVAGEEMGLLEPWQDCQPSRSTQLFHLEWTAPERYRIRSAQAGLCVGIRDDEQVNGAEFQVEACTGGADQEYRIQFRE